MAHDPNSERSEHTVTRAINAYKDSDSSVAANLIVERFESRIYALARKRAENMKVRNDLADLVNESFFKLFQQLKQNPENIANSDHLWTVLANILKQKTIDRLRHVYAESRGGAGRNAAQERLGQHLVEKGLITKDQLEQVNTELASNRSKSIEQVLVDRGLVDYEQISRALVEMPSDHREQDRQSIVKSDDAGNELSFDQFPEEFDSDEAAEEMVDKFFQLVAKMEDKNLLAIVKAKSEGLSNQQIGEQLGISRESVRRKFELIKQLAIEKIASN